MIYQKNCLKLLLLKIKVDEDSEYDDYPYEEHNTYVIDTNSLDTDNDIENIIVIETDDVVMDECEICHKKFKQRGLKNH